MARDYAAEYRRRMELGRERGIEPEAARGHRGAAGFRQAIRSGRVFDVYAIPGDRVGGHHKGKSRYTTVKVEVQTTDGRTRVYTAPIAMGRRWARDLDRAGIPYEPKYGLEGPS